MDIQNLIGFILPPLVDMIFKIDIPWLDADGDSKVRMVVSFLACAIVGIVVNINDLRPFNLNQILGNIAIVFTTAQLTYKMYWKNSDAREVLDEKVDKLLK